MSYANGIGMAQQSLSLIAAASTKETTQADAVKQSGVATTNNTNLSLRQDAATLTSTGGALAQSVADSDTDTAKIAALQQAIATGSYDVSSSAVAEKLIATLVQPG